MAQVTNEQEDGAVSVDPPAASGKPPSSSPQNSDDTLEVENVSGGAKGRKIGNEIIIIYCCEVKIILSC